MSAQCANKIFALLCHVQILFVCRDPRVRNSICFVLIHASQNEKAIFAFCQEPIPIWMKGVPIGLIIYLIAFRHSTTSAGFLVRTAVQSSTVADYGFTVVSSTA